MNVMSEYSMECWYKYFADKIIPLFTEKEVTGYGQKSTQTTFD